MALNLKQIESEIVDQYFNDKNPRPWIIGFSGGKDSTMLLQVVWNAIKVDGIQLFQNTRQIYVVCNNTLVENPKIIEYTDEVLNNIEKAAVEQGLPIQVVRTRPKLEDSFWVNLIGKGYPAPNRVFRWCTDRLKIDPTTQFIKTKVDETGEVIILLGTRKDESAKRAASIKKHSISNSRLRKHLLPNAFVFAPIQDVTTDEVWQYLLQVPSPWGSNNKKLMSIYRNANSGDCPMVIDHTTPSCGNSRFGCWVCTVVEKDKSMEALVDNGEEWMEPLLDFRDLLAESRNNLEWREKTNAFGQPNGAYLPLKRQLILEKLLSTQKQIEVEQPELKLINFQELVAIQKEWQNYKPKAEDEENEFTETVAEIYNRIYNKSFDALSSKEKNDEYELAKNIFGEDFRAVQELLEVQQTKTVLVKSRGLANDLENKIEVLSRMD